MHRQQLHAALRGRLHSPAFAPPLLRDLPASHAPLLLTASALPSRCAASRLVNITDLTSVFDLYAGTKSYMQVPRGPGLDLACVLAPSQQSGGGLYVTAQLPCAPRSSSACCCLCVCNDCRAPLPASLPAAAAT